MQLFFPGKWASLIILSFLLPGTTAFSQESKQDSLTQSYLTYDSLILAELGGDSLSILSLIDSLLNSYKGYSSLSVRSGYVSNIVYAGRDFGVTQYGFSGGISYYHKSGFYGDISGYWNSDFEPQFNPLIPSIGYMGIISPTFSIMANYEHYFYFNSDSVIYDFPLTHSLNASPYLDYKFISFGIDYSFLFGDETAHRIRPGAFGRIRIKNAGIIDEIQFLPGVSLLFGDATIYSFNPNYMKLKEFYERVGGVRFLLTMRALRKRYGDQLTEYIMANNLSEENVFGLMNYNFSIPVTFRINNFTLSISYFYNIPVPLPGEEIEYEPNSYISTSLIYSIPFRK